MAALTLDFGFTGLNPNPLFPFDTNNFPFYRSSSTVFFPPEPNSDALISGPLLLQHSEFDVDLPAPPFVSAKRPASEDDWVPHKASIRHLYLEEDMPLKEVMEIMEIHHGFKATVKMYKSHIKKWKLDKKNKAADIKALIRKKTQRDAVGKKSVFHIRGRPVDIDDAFRYLKRNKITIEDVMEQPPSTPPDLRCYTPEPVPSSPTPPRILEIPNRILINIQSYMDGSFDSHTWTQTDERRLCRSVKSTREGATTISSVFYNINRACKFFNQGWNRHAGQLLLKGAAGIQDLLGEDHPQLLAQVFQTMFDLQRSGRQDISDMLLKQFRDMSATIFLEGHPLRQIFAYLHHTESETQKDLLIKAWEFFTDTFEYRLGRDSKSAVDVRLDYLCEIQLATNPDHTVRELQQLAQEYQKLFPVTDWRHRRTVYALSSALRNIGKFGEARASADYLLRIADIYDGGRDKEPSAARLAATNLQALCSFEEGDRESAEAIQRQLIDISMDFYGPEYAITQHYQARLAKWLTKWGRTAEADLIAENLWEILQTTSTTN